MRKRVLGFYEAWSCIALWKSKEVQLAEVRRMFEKKEVTNLTRIRLNQKIVNDQTEGSAGNALEGEASSFPADAIDY